jgi:hypothetical protein
VHDSRIWASAVNAAVIGAVRILCVRLVLSTETAGWDIKNLATVEPVPVGNTIGATLPPVQVVTHRVQARHGVIALGVSSVNDPAGHLWPGPAPRLSLSA